MRMFKFATSHLLLILVAVLLAGCGQEVVTIPTVVSTTPVNGATVVSVNTAINATFSMAMNPASITASSFQVTDVSGTAVAGAVSYSGTTATFTPAAALAFSTTYTATITTAAKNLGGISLLSNYVWSFSTITPPPVVIATVPVNGATGVPVNQVLSATFNEAISCATIASPLTTFSLTGPGATVIPGNVTCAGASVTFTPASVLAFNTTYAATITTAAKSLAGTSLAANYVWRFLTVAAPTPPTVISTVPINGATGVLINEALSATFSVAMDPTTIGAATFTLRGPGGTAVTGLVTYTAAGSIATFKPSVDLLPSSLYTATVTTGAMDLENTALVNNFVWTFTTAAAIDTTKPTVMATIPLNNATNVSLNQTLGATFSEAMDPATMIGANFTLQGPGTTTVIGLVAYAAISQTFSFDPVTNLEPSTLYTATITTGAADLAGNTLAVDYVWTFTTGTTVDTTSPEIVSTLPLNNATNVPITQSVSATFSEAMAPLTITNGTFGLTGPGGATVATTVVYDPITFIATLTPVAPLAESTTYTAIVTGARDLTGNRLGNTGAPNPWTFTTGLAVAPPVVLGPTIVQFGGFGGNAGMTNQGLSSAINGGFIGTTAASTLMTGFHDDSIVTSTGVASCTYTETPLNLALVGAPAATPGSGVITIFTAAGTSLPTVACPLEGTADTFSTASEAALEARTAYTTLQGLPPGITLPSNELGNRTLAPGTYTSSSFYNVTEGPLTLDAQGDSNAYWIFQMGSALTVGTPTASQSVVLINGAQASHVFWAVGGSPGAVINYGGGGTMVGTVISQPGITVSSPGVAAVTTINGRVIALGASVTIVNTVINVPAP